MSQEIKEKIKHHEVANNNIKKEIEANLQIKLRLRERIQDLKDDLTDLKDEGADRKEIRAMKNKLEIVYKEKRDLSTKYYWLKNQERTCLENLSLFKKELEEV